MSFRSDIESLYTDKEGLVSKDVNPTEWSSGNGLLYTSIYYTLLKLRNELIPSDVVEFKRIYTSLQNFPGTFNRNVNRTDLNAHDDLTGLVACSRLIEPNRDAAKAVFWHGIKYQGCFNNVDNKRTFRSLQWRHLDFMSHCFVSAYNVRIFVPIQLDYIANINLEDTTSIILAWLQLESLNNDDVKLNFQIAIRKKYLDGMRSVFASYFGPTHPFAMYAI